MRMKIAITGGIGSGKSSVLRHLQERGYSVFSCDEIYKEVIQSAPYIKKIKACFPQCFVDNQIDREKLASIVFQNPDARLALNAIAHPLIMSLLHEKMENCKAELIFAEVPLLFEGGFQDQFDKILVVMREESERISSVVQRDGLSPQEVKNRISAQFDYHSQKAKEIFSACNAICIYNNQKEEDLKKTIDELLLKLQS